MAEPKSKPTPLYKEVYDYILNRIVREEWQEHDKLPSVRDLANTLSVHRLTVFKAYQLLKDDGKVYVRDKSGYFVQGHAETRELSSLFEKKSRLSEIHRIPVTYQFSQALIDPNLLPNHYFSAYVKKVFDLYPKVLGTYSTIQGDEELRETLAGYFFKRHGLDLSADELLITSGAQQAIHLIAQLLIKPRDIVLLERPSYSAAIEIFRSQGAKIIPVDITKEGYDLVQVEAYMKEYKPVLFYVNPTFQNPTGYTVPAHQRKALVELAEKYRCVLVEDDTYFDIYFEKEPPAPIFKYDSEGMVVYIRSFSKYIAPGLRIAAMVCRQPLMNHLLTAKSLTDNGSPLLNQKIFLHYFTSARMQQHLEKLRIALSIRKEILESELKNTGWEWTSPDGGLNLWIKLPPSIDTNELLSKVLESSISFVPGIIFDPLNELQSYIRLSYSYINEQQLREGARKLVNLSKNNTR